MCLMLSERKDIGNDNSEQNYLEWTCSIVPNRSRIDLQLATYSTSMRCRYLDALSMSDKSDIAHSSNKS
jgi:hypothetical protein